MSDTLAQAPVSPERNKQFSKRVRVALCYGEIPFRKACLRALVDRVEVSKGLIRLVGRKCTLKSSVRAPDGAPPPVRSFVREWRAVLNRCANPYVIEMAC